MVNFTETEAHNLVVCLYLRSDQMPEGIFKDSDNPTPEEIERDNRILERWSSGSMEEDERVIQELKEDVPVFLRQFPMLIEELQSLPEDASETDIQTLFYDHAKLAFGEDKKSIRRFFILTYQVMLGTDSGPRFGQFVSLYGRDKFIDSFIDRVRNPHELKGT